MKLIPALILVGSIALNVVFIATKSTAIAPEASDRIRRPIETALAAKIGHIFPHTFPVF